MERRRLIATTAVRLVGRGGTHQLTHRAVDAAAGLPPGSTSYYARTRRDLLRLVIDELSAATSRDLASLVVPERLTPTEARDLIGSLVDTMAERGDAQVARFALMLEVRDDAELRAALTETAPVRAELRAAAGRLLRALGADDAAGAELVALVDALQMYRAVDAAPVDVRHVVATYLRGLTLPGDGS